MAVGGVTYKKPINQKLYIKSTLAYARQYQYTDHRYILRTLDTVNNQWIYNAKPFNMMGYGFDIGTISGYLSLNQKLNQKHVLKYGLNVDTYHFNLVDSIRTDITDSLSSYYYRWGYATQNPEFLVQAFCNGNIK